MSRNKTILLLVAVGFGILTLAGSLVVQVFADDSFCDIGSILQRIETSNGVESLRERVCFESGELVYTQWISENEVEKRLATENEITAFAAKQITDEIPAAEIRLNSDIEVGKNWVAILREWSNDYQQTAADWDTLSTSEKLDRMEIKISRDGKVLSGLADLLITLGY